jgi:uncharacterized OB-fold protein
MGKYEKPLPIINEDTKPYWEYCHQHELRMQKCKECGNVRFPSSILCPACHSMETDWEKLSGKGRVYSFIVFRLAYHEAYQNDIPYVVAIIELEEGPRMESNIIGCKIEDVKIGMPVEVVFDDVTEDVALPKFKPVS